MFLPSLHYWRTPAFCTPGLCGTAAGGMPGTSLAVRRGKGWVKVPLKGSSLRGHGQLSTGSSATFGRKVVCFSFWRWWEVVLAASFMVWRQETLQAASQKGGMWWMHWQRRCPKDLQQGPCCCQSARCTLPQRARLERVGYFAVRAQFNVPVQRRRGACSCFKSMAVINNLLTPFSSELQGGFAFSKHEMLCIFNTCGTTPVFSALLLMNLLF